jgi:hypothetical protein
MKCKSNPSTLLNKPKVSVPQKIQIPEQMMPKQSTIDQKSGTCRAHMKINRPKSAVIATVVGGKK